MRFTIFCLLFLSATHFCIAQNDTISAVNNATPKKTVRFGYNFHLNYNLYTWYQTPTTTSSDNHSVGQALNILPGLGGGIWVGDVKNWLLSVDASVQYLPFAFDTEQFTGMGSLAFPVATKIQFPIAKQNSTWLMMHLGAGVQFVKTDCYARPETLATAPNPFYATYYGEVGFHISAVAYRLQHLREVELFFQAGAGANQNMLFGAGLKLTYWNAIK